MAQAGLLSLAILPVPVHGLTPGQVFTKVKDAVVVVTTWDAKGRLIGQGSGVMISPGRIATNYHVVEGGASFEVSRSEQVAAATLYADDRKKDICLLDAKSIRGEPVQLGKAATLKVGDPVFAVGAPEGLELSLSDGIVAQLRGGTAALDSDHGGYRQRVQRRGAVRWGGPTGGSDHLLILEKRAKPELCPARGVDRRGHARPKTSRRGPEPNRMGETCRRP
jgi:S1-C subfamily serine protease